MLVMAPPSRSLAQRSHLKQYLRLLRLSSLIAMPRPLVDMTSCCRQPGGGLRSLVALTCCSYGGDLSDALYGGSDSTNEISDPRRLVRVPLTSASPFSTSGVLGVLLLPLDLRSLFGWSAHRRPPSTPEILATVPAIGRPKCLSVHSAPGIYDCVVL